MTLTKYRLGDLIEEVDHRNDLGIRDFRGVNIYKQFMPTQASTENLDESKYKLVTKHRFVFSGMQTGRDETIRLACSDEDAPFLVSPAYITFDVKRLDVIHPMYLFVKFSSTEMDRLGWFLSDSSIRANLAWEDFCDIVLTLPPLSVQRKYVAIYQAMKANLESMQAGLDYLALLQQGLLQDVKHTYQRQPLNELLEEIDERNTDSIVLTASGINIHKRFFPSAAAVSDITNYKLVKARQFAYSAMQTGRDECVRIALSADNEIHAVSPAYSVLRVKDESVVDPRFMMAWFSRTEIDRLGWFSSDASIRASLDLKRFLEFEIPLPPLEIQKVVTDLVSCISSREIACRNLEAKLREICPILIKGSLDEGHKTEVLS